MSFFSDVADGITGHSPNAESVAALNNAQANILNAQAQALAGQNAGGSSKSTPIIIAVVVMIIILALIALFIKMKKK